MKNYDTTLTATEPGLDTDAVLSSQYSPATNSELKITVGKTYNLGNYESLRVDVSCSRPTSAQTLEQDAKDLQNRCFQIVEKFAKEKMGV